MSRMKQAMELILARRCDHTIATGQQCILDEEHEGTHLYRNVSDEEES